MENILTLLIVLIAAIAFSCLDLFFRGKKVWVGKNEHENLYLIQTRITRRYVLYDVACGWDYYRILDKNKDGIADCKQHVYAVGRTFQKISEEVSDMDKQIYAYALRQIKN